MEGAKLIIEEINREAEQKIKYLLDEAQKQAEEIKREAEDRGKAKAEWILRKAETQAEIEKQRIVASARLESRKKKLEIQEELIKEVFQELRDRLSSLPDDEYIDTIKALLLESLRELEADSVVLRSDEKTLALIKEKSRSIKAYITRNLGRKVEMELGEPIHTMGGVLVESADGRIRVDNTFEARISRLESELRARIAKALFG